MSYESAKELNEETLIAKKDGRDFFIPKNSANTDYQEIMRLVEAGELVIEPADPEPEADA